MKKMQQDVGKQSEEGEKREEGSLEQFSRAESLREEMAKVFFLLWKYLINVIFNCVCERERERG